MALRETLIILAVIVLLLVIGLPFFAGRSFSKSPRIQCVNNLKTIGLTLRIYAFDHDERYPQAIPRAQGGSLESVLQGGVAETFRLLSKHLESPGIFWCPADKERERPRTWQAMTDADVSYFLGTGSSATNGSVMLSGDRDLTIGGELLAGQYLLLTNMPVQWSGRIHAEGGNVLMGDGSVQMSSTQTLPEVLGFRGTGTNRLVFPN